MGYQYLKYGDTYISHMFSQNLLLNFQHQELLHLKNVQYLHNVPNLYVDIWILTELANQADLEILREVAQNPDQIYCCYL